jgi:hypothetical protein
MFTCLMAVWEVDIIPLFGMQLLLFAYILKVLDFYMVLCSCTFEGLFMHFDFFWEKCSFRDYALRLCTMRIGSNS